MRLTSKVCPVCGTRLYYDYHEKVYVCTFCNCNFDLEEVSNG